MSGAPEERHSALYLSDARDLWWNADFLALLAARAGLSKARRVLDVGAGLGHWTRTVARLSPGAELVGLERDAGWVEQARAPSMQAPAAVSFLQGVAEAIPFDDGAFDVVTCQTLLIHVKDPRAVVREMLRVLAPGGRLLLAEPNNLAQTAARLVVEPGFDVDDLLATLKLEALCEKGKHALGLGYNSIGEGLAGLLDPGLVDDVQVFNNDKCVVFAPGEDHAARPEVVDQRRLLAAGPLGWPEDEARRYFVAGGGDPADFAPLCERARRAEERRLRALEDGALATNEGSLFYVLVARKR